eukprot:726857-Pelagomonas_calceolata.AAC.1
MQAALVIGVSRRKWSSHCRSIQGYFARVYFHLARAGVCECLDLGRGSAFATQDFFIGTGW